MHRTLLVAPRSSSSNGVLQNDITGHTPTTNTRCLLQTTSKTGGFHREGRRPPTLPACQRAPPSPHPSIKPPASGSLPSHFQGLGVIVTMMFPECSLPVRRVTIEPYFVLLTTQGGMDCCYLPILWMKKLRRTRLSCHTANSSGRARTRIQEVWTSSPLNSASVSQFGTQVCFFWP